MPITINGSGTVTGISAGGLPDAIITAPELSGAQTGSAPIYGCRAWVNFDGTRNEADTGASTNGANVKIRASGNVTSVLKNGVGVYTVNFTTAMPDANYSAIVSGNEQGSLTGVIGVTQTLAAGSLQIYNYSPSAILGDRATISVAIFR
jgi:hypothetical protein